WRAYGHWRLRGCNGRSSFGPHQPGRDCNAEGSDGARRDNKPPQTSDPTWHRRRRNERYRRDSSGTHRVRTHWPSDIFDALLANVRERVGEFVSDLVTHDARDTDPARLRQRLQPGGYVNAISEDVVVLGDDIPEVDPDTELNPRLGRGARIPLSHPALHFQCAAHRIHKAGKFGKHPIAGILHNAAAVLLDLRIDQFAKMRPEPRVRAFLVYSHQARVSGDISGENGC